MSSSRSGMPALADIAAYWSGHPGELPDADFRYTGSGEPSCFRCGWLPPVPDSAWLRKRNGTAFRSDAFDASGYRYAQHSGWPRERALKATWQAAGRFLDRAHLADYFTSGDNSLRNIVPLCHFPCHHDMPDLLTRRGALEWVAAGPRAPGWWQMLTDTAGQAGNLTERRGLRGLYRRGLETIAQELGIAA